MLEVVVWNEVYLKISNLLSGGRVVEVRGTLDKRDEGVRATAQDMKSLASDHVNGTNETSTILQQPAVLLQFSMGATSDELRQVREILASSPGQRPVRLLFDRASGGPVRLDAGTTFKVNLTRDLEQKLARWLVTTKS